MGLVSEAQVAKSAKDGILAGNRNGGGMTQETSYDTMFGKMAVEQGLCTHEELQQAIKELKERLKTNPILLKDLMVDLGYLTRHQAERL